MNSDILMLTQCLKMLLLINGLTAWILRILISIGSFPINRRGLEQRNFVCWIKIWSCLYFRGNISPKGFHFAVFSCLQFISGDRHCSTKGVLLEIHLHFLINVCFKLASMITVLWVCSHVTEVIVIEED